MLRQQSSKMRFVGSNIQVYYDNLHNRLSADFQSRVGEIRDLWPCRTFGPWCLSHEWHMATLRWSCV